MAVGCGGACTQLAGGRRAEQQSATALMDAAVTGFTHTGCSELGSGDVSVWWVGRLTIILFSSNGIKGKHLPRNVHL